MLKKSLIIFLSAFFFLTFAFAPLKNNILKAQEVEKIQEPSACPKGVLGKTDLFASIKKITDLAGGNVEELSKVSTGLTMIECLVWGSINFLLEVSWIVALILIMISGIKYMSSAGNPKAMEEAIKSLTSAVIGFIAIMLVFALLNFFLDFIEYSAFVKKI